MGRDIDAGSVVLGGDAVSRPRLHDDGFLQYLRKHPCCICRNGRVDGIEAAHIRIGFRALGKKPDDRFATPLCTYHHRLQHNMNEEQFWREYGEDPFAIAERLYAEYGGTGGKPRVKRKTVKPRKPKEQRAKIRSRGFQKRNKI